MKNLPLTYYIEPINPDTKKLNFLIEKMNNIIFNDIILFL